MARLEYAGSDLPAGPDAAIVERIRTRRGGTLTPLDQMLLHSPPLADGWNTLLGAVRTATTLAGDVRELAILRVAARNGADYEWNSHEPIGRAAGLTDADLAAVRADRDHSDSDGESGGGPTALDPRLAVALAYTDAMTTHVTVPDEVFARLREHFTDREVVELTVTVGAYNLVSRFLVALHVGDDPEPDTAERGND